MRTRKLGLGIIGICILLCSGGCEAPRQGSSRAIEDIRIATFKHHVTTWLERVEGGPKHYTVFFLDTQSEREARALSSLSQRAVKVVCGTNDLTFGNGHAVLDKRTGSPAVLFAVKVERLGSSEALTRASASTAELGGEFWRYKLIRSDGVWIVRSRESDGYASAGSWREAAIDSSTPLSSRRSGKKLVVLRTD
jgi:hypothetical protein